MYVITGATSRTGHLIAELLLKAGQPVRVVGRSAERLQPLARLGAEIAVAEPDDSVALTAAFSGAKAAWVMLQPNYIIDSPDFRGFQQRVIRALSTALSASTVTHAVALSSWGAGRQSGTGPVLGLHELEQMLARHTALNVLNLRAGYFMENTLGFVDSILAHGEVRSPFAADVVMPFIATPDISTAAAKHLLALDFSGQQALELHGAKSMSLGEATYLIGNALARSDLAYRQISEAAFVESLRGAGAADNVIELMKEVVIAVNSGWICAEQPRSAASTGTVRYEHYIADVMLPRLAKA